MLIKKPIIIYSTLSFFLPLPRPPSSTLFPYTTLFRSKRFTSVRACMSTGTVWPSARRFPTTRSEGGLEIPSAVAPDAHRSEEHTSELQSRVDLVCRLLLEKKKK